MSSDSGFETAREIYDNGGYMDSYAVLTLSGANIPVGGISKGTAVKGLTEDDREIEGQVGVNMSPGSTTLAFKYPIFDIEPPAHSGCIVGSLPAAWQTTGGCLQQSGVLNIAGVGEVNYTYSIEDNNISGRSFGRWSTQADSMMDSCAGGCPYSEFSKFKKYYGQSDYANEWISAAFEGRYTNFAGMGGADFSTYGNDGRTQAIMKGTAYMIDPMIVIRQLEFALDNCESSKDEAVKAWDEAVAFYTGSQALGEPGLLMYALADKRCKNFKTCGREANELEGTSYINLELFDIFALGQYNLQGSQCDSMRDLVDRAVALMAIGQIQGTLRYAYKVGMDVDTSEKAKAEGAVFAAGVLPRVHACNEADAKTIYDNMKVGAASTDFQAVVTAFEKNYGCMGISAWEVGAVYDTDANNGEGGYLYGNAEKLEATASAATEPSSEKNTNTLAIGLGVGLCADGNAEKLEATASAATEPSSNEKNTNTLAIGLGVGSGADGNAEKLEATASAATEHSSSEKNTNILAIGLGVGLGAAALILISMFFMMRSKKNEPEPVKFVNEGVDPVV